MGRRLTDRAESEIRLYDFLRTRMGLTKKQISRLKYTNGGILVNGREVYVTEILHPGDLVDADAGSVPAEGHSIRPSSLPLTILYEDEDIIALNKPAGVSSHPAGIHQEDTIVNRLVYHFRENGEPVIPHPVGRLDISTSGVICFAKNRTALARLIKQRERKLLYKEYTAVVSGHFGNRCGEIELPLRRDPANALRVIVSEDGKYAKTVYEVIGETEEVSLVNLRILTGRMHQIRVHMAAAGHPLLGDQLYGGCTDRIARAALHAGKMVLYRPFSDEKLELAAPLPEDMRKLL